MLSKIGRRSILKAYTSPAATETMSAAYRAAGKASGDAIALRARIGQVQKEGLIEHLRRSSRHCVLSIILHFKYVIDGLCVVGVWAMCCGVCHFRSTRDRDVEVI